MNKIIMALLALLTAIKLPMINQVVKSEPTLTYQKPDTVIVEQPVLVANPVVNINPQSLDNHPVRVIGSLSPANWQNFQNEYYALPAQLKAAISEIIFSSENLSTLCGLNLGAPLKGCSNSDTNQIYLDSIYRYGDLRHEAIHLFSYQTNAVFSDEFAACFNQEGANVNYQEGNYHDIYEYFVQAYILYLDAPRQLSQRCPMTYQYFISFKY